MTARADRCPTCGTPCLIAGKTTQHYEPITETRLAKLERVAEAARLVQSVDIEDRAYYRDAHERLDDALRALDAETEAG